jgi:hypothetical protein
MVDLHVSPKPLLRANACGGVTGQRVVCLHYICNNGELHVCSEMVLCLLCVFCNYFSLQGAAPVIRQPGAALLCFG